MLLGLLLLPANRSRDAWQILIPVFGVEAAVLALGLVFGAIKFTLIPIMSIPIDFVHAVLMGVAALWLVGHWLGGKTPAVSVLGAVAVLACVGGISVPCFGGLDFGPGLWDLAIPYCIGTGAVLVGLIAVAKNLRGEQAQAKPVANALTATFCASFLISLVVTVIVAVLAPSEKLDISSWFAVVMVGLIVGMFVGIISFGTLFIFLLLTQRNAVYNERLRAVAGLGEASDASAAPPASEKESETV